MLLATEFVLLFSQNLLLENGIGLSGILRIMQQKLGLLPLGLLTLLYSALNGAAADFLLPLLPKGAVWYALPVCTVLFCGLLDLLTILLITFFCSANRAKVYAQIVHAAAYGGAVLGSLLLMISQPQMQGSAFSMGVQNGLSYLFACLLLHVAVPVLYSEKMPAAVRGWRGVFLYTGILSLAASCFSS